jgi:hypothetical protein
MAKLVVQKFSIHLSDMEVLQNNRGQVTMEAKHKGIKAKVIRVIWNRDQK